MRDKFLWKLVLWGALVLLAPQSVSGGNALSDAQNKEIVYKMYSEYRQDFPEVPDISSQEAMKLLSAERLVLVDVRKPMEREISMLPHAITKKKYLEDRSAYKQHTVVAYCTIGYRSGIFAREMAEKGVVVYNLRGGLLGWVHEGGKVYHDNGELKRIHVLGKKWDYPPQDYESVKASFFQILFK